MTFDELADWWRMESGFHSAPSLIMEHPAFAQIVAMGEAALPHIEKRLERGEGSGWFLVLRSILNTGPEIDIHTSVSVREAWLGFLRNRVAQ